MKENKFYSRYVKRRYRRNLFRILIILGLFTILYIFFRIGEKTNMPENENDLDSKIFNNSISSSLSTIFMYEENATLWGFTNGIDSLLEQVVDKRYWGPAMRRTHEGSLDEFTITNISCHRLQLISISEEEMWRRYERHRKVKEITGCDALSIPFNPMNDNRCIQFMTNSSNWKELIPIAQSEDQRTIKFEIVFKPIYVSNNEVIDRPVETVIKVPQRHFPSEAAGESAAFHADRILLINRIPPTGWACIPLWMIKESVKKYKNNVETTEVFLRMSGVKNYEEWIEKDLFDFVRQNHHMELVNSNENLECIGISIQLKIADVGHFLSSVMRIPYESHSDTWHTYFDLNNSIRKRIADFIENSAYVGILHLAEINMFDYIIGNMDRSPNKNNFVVGGTRLSPNINNNNFMLHPNHPSFIYLDHGMAFYRRRPRRNAITKSYESFKKNKSDTFCLFRGPMLRRIYELMKFTGGPKNETLFTFKMKKRLPKRVYSIIGSDGLRYCSMRGKEILAMAERCLQNERIRSYVLFP